jgi:SAM-dependent methyltransferase
MTIACKICVSPTEPAGSKFGQFAQREFSLRHCPACRFSFVADPWTEYDRIYSEAYYHGQGADPFVDYVFELEHPDQTLRQYEWRGIIKTVSALTPLTPQTEWLDFGGGNGGLVRHVRQHRGCKIVGYDIGWITDRAKSIGIPFLSQSELESHHARYDVVTAIEVLEHIEDPLSVLTLLRRVIKPGGVLFLTTGNAKPFRGRLPEWGYVNPEVHISFFEPETLDRALRHAGFVPAHRGFLPGYADIIRFKTLKTLRQRRPSLLERLIPWSIASRIVDARFGVSQHPIGIAAPKETT